MMPGTLATGVPQEGSRMNYVLSRLLVISACLFIGEAAIAGEIPTAGELIESLPLLDSENGDLDSFALTFAMNAGDGVNLEWQVVWEKDGQQGFLLCVGDAKTIRRTRSSSWRCTTASGTQTCRKCASCC